MDTPRVEQVPEGSGEQRKLEETGCEVILGTPKTSAVKGSVKVKEGEPCFIETPRTVPKTRGLTDDKKKFVTLSY